MSSVVVRLADVLVHQLLQMKFVEYDDMIEQISSTTADPAFRNAVLPGTSEAGPFGLDAEALHETGHLFIEVRGPVEDQILRGAIVCSIAFSSW